VTDRWASWLAERRFGGSDEARRESQQLFQEFRSRVLDGARITAGETVLDVGCGEGLIGFGALELVGPNGKVIFSDVSEDVLNVCRSIAAGDARCEFVRASADDLPFDDRSVDVITTRSVVMYLEDKEATFREFSRVLRPGGRLSLFEPINSFGNPEPDGVFAGYDVGEVADLAAMLRAGAGDGDSMLLGWDERDLVRWLELADFNDIDLTLEIEVKPHPMVKTRNWDAFRNHAPNPLACTLQELLDEALTPEEHHRFVACLRPLVERGEGTCRMASAYVRALKA
jgi:arsenite methyltransferase